MCWDGFSFVCLNTVKMQSLILVVAYTVMQNVKSAGVLDEYHWRSEVKECGVFLDLSVLVVASQRIKLYCTYFSCALDFR